MADREDRGADLPQRDAGSRRTSEPGRTARSFAHAKATGGTHAAGRRPEVVTYRVDDGGSRADPTRARPADES